MVCKIIFQRHFYFSCLSVPHSIPYKYDYFHIGVTVGLTQSLVKAFEGEGSVEICAALEKGQLGIYLSVFIETESGNVSGDDTFVSDC